MNLASLPSEMHRDELAIGYNAYSLTLTGYDEHAAGPWPFIFKSFGDFKLPGLMYTTALSVHMFGLHVWSVRIVTALLASLLIPVSYLFVHELFKSRRIAILTAGLLTVSYWHVFLARTAYEPIAALTIWILALYLLLKGRTHRWSAFVSALCFLGSFAFYNVPLLLSPFILALYVGCFWPTFKKRLIVNSAAIGIIAGLVIITVTALSAVSSAKSKTTLFNNSELASQLQEFKNAAFIAQSPEVVRLLSINKYMFWSTVFAKNYLSTFDTNYLFFSGGKNVWHNLNSLELGDFNVLTIPFILVGLWMLIGSSARGSRAHWFLLGYLFISPVPDALTIDAPVTNRLLDFHFALTIVAALGIYQLLEWSRKRAVIAAATLGVGLLYGYFVLVFWFRYYYLHPYVMAPAWNETIGVAAQLTDQHSAQFKRIHVNNREIPGSFERLATPYIYFLFASQLDPRTVQSQASWEEQGGFQTIAKVGIYDFSDLPRPGHPEQEPILYVTRSDLTELDPRFSVTQIFATTDRAGKTTWRGYSLVTHE